MPDPIVRRFIVISRDGWTYRLFDQSRFMYMPLGTEFEAIRINDENIMLNTNLVPTKKDGNIAIIEKECVDDMLWKVIHQKQFIDIFSDPLLSIYQHTYYENSEIIVDSCNHHAMDTKLYKILEQSLYFELPYEIPLVPMKNFILCRITNTDGVLLRKDKEIYSPLVGLLAFNTKIVIQNKEFSNIPTTKNIKRLELFNNKGWISYMNADEKPNIEIIGICDDPFEYDATTLVIQLDHSPFQMMEDTQQQSCIICLHNKRTIAILHDSYGHLVYCNKCAEIMQNKKEKCPICRTQIVQYLRMY